MFCEAESPSPAPPSGEPPLPLAFGAWPLPAGASAGVRPGIASGVEAAATETPAGAAASAAALGWLAARLHLHVFDRMFLNRGSLEAYRRVTEN